MGAVTADVEWNDPRDSFVGIDELEQAMRRLRTSKPDYAFVIASEIDRHHDRLRDRWDMVRKARTLMEGLNVVTLEPSSGLVARRRILRAPHADQAATAAFRWSFAASRSTREASTRDVIADSAPLSSPAVTLLRFSCPGWTTRER